MRVTEIRRAHISKMHASLSDRPGAANRALTVVQAVLNWTAAERDDLELPPNPARASNGTQNKAVSASSPPRKWHGSAMP